MVVGVSVMVILTMRMPRRLALVHALLVFTFGQPIIALTPVYAVALVAVFEGRDSSFTWTRVPSG